MNRDIAFRASIPFFIIMVISAITGISAQADAAEAVFLISAVLSIILGALAFALPVRQQQAIPIRVQRNR